jgi:predicted GNAT superfamily acetyltransferase
MWFLYFLPILIVIPFIIVANRHRGGGKGRSRSVVLGLALIVAVGAAGFAAVELMR